MKTDQQIDWTLTNGGAISLTVHFDLSQSIVLAGATYKLKPVLHLFNNDPVEAATICGSVTAGSFVEGDFPNTENLGRRGLALLFSSVMREDEVDTVCDALRAEIVAV